MNPNESPSQKTRQATPRADDSVSPDSTASAAPSTRSPSEVPPRIGRYEIRAVLGEGAFGRVYRGFDPELHREVAIKVPHANALTPDLRERFLREARAAATIHHPNVCPIHDVGTADGVPYLVMHFIAGGTLAGLLSARKKPFSPAHAAAVVRKIALGVEAAHAKGVLHRDLKPANVLWDESSREVLVTDFGLARIGGAAQLSRSGEVLGTPAYMSPEQARGRQEEIGPLADVYSLGVILYRILAGKVPFEGSLMEVLANTQFAEPEPPSSIRLGLDPRLDAICLKAMAKKPDARYASPKDFAVALADFIRSSEKSDAGTVPVLPPPDLVADSATAPLPLDEFVSPPRQQGMDPEEESVRKRIVSNTTATGRFGTRRVLLASAVVAVCLGGVFLLAQAMWPGGNSSTAQQSSTGNQKAEPTLPPVVLVPKPGETREVEVAPGVAMTFCWIPSGTAQLGAPKSELDSEPSVAEERRGKFTTKGFWMGKYEVTQAEWGAVMNGTALATPSDFRIGGEYASRLQGIKDTSKFPVDSVGWDDCKQFLKAADRHGGIQKAFGRSGAFALPQEDQWEYASRGGLGNSRAYHWGGELDGSQANCAGDVLSLERPVPVGSYESKHPHPWGLCDMHGNVWEWCENAHEGTTNRVLRGGSWMCVAGNCRSFYRGFGSPASRASYFGCRVCLSLD